MECRNCNHLISTESIFCNACGEKTTFKRLTVKSFIVDFFNQFLSIDNKLFKTFIDLFRKPDLVIDSYINGFRKTYVNVISYLGLSITLMGLQFFILKKFFPELLQYSAGLEQPEGFDISSVMDFITEYQSVITLVSIPVYSLISRFVFKKSKKYNIAEHFVIITYTSAHWFIISFFIILITLPFGLNFYNASQLISIPALFYMAYVYKKLYEFSWKSTILRTILYTVISFLFPMIIALIFGILYAAFYLKN
ncbi:MULTISPECIES: DUF3667 domain-containing protein [unclassified Algibacter]|uniref:DUF3667 domain-containing protein n=1 Tax=unclassified Algibacter TaxID=2615009 RepID=UPI00131AD14C|nr:MULTISPECIES: DUF3667 domain-containing protein [unclassified Algibacter]MCL5129541.1 DUF3667 domain-containing protein [Algibacter sp. L4_22]